MSSYTVSVNGNSSHLRSTLFPPIRLQNNTGWEAALLDFTTYNSIPNITQGLNNKLHYYKSKSESGSYGLMETATLKTGSYEIDDINKELQKQLGRDNIEVTANNNLLRTVIKSKFYIDFSQLNSIGSILGFSKNTEVLEPGLQHIGNENVNIIKVNTINITCNIIQGSYKDGVNQHILHTFYPTVAPGFKIVEKPHNLVYLPLSSTSISDVELSILDQDGNFIDFRGETISARVHIKRSL